MVAWRPQRLCDMPATCVLSRSHRADYFDRAHVLVTAAYGFDELPDGTTCPAVGCNQLAPPVDPYPKPDIVLAITAGVRRMPG